MKKNLRLLCLGLAAASFATSFAQTDVTSKLVNADMERGVSGWDITFDSHNWGLNRNKSKRAAGFYGFKDISLEAWSGSTPMTNNSISQTLKNLPNGTYVFGAYIGASKQDGEVEDNKNIVTGVSLFANDAVIPVATNNPDRGTKIAHTTKFNVATTVAEGANLHVGLKVEGSNVTYVCWDNVELYHFADKTPEEALLEVAKMDMARTIAISDTVIGKKMSVDTLAYLTESVVLAKAITSQEDAQKADEELRWAIYLGNKSVNEYKSLADQIAAANDTLAAHEWTDENAVEAFKTAIATAQAVYDEAKANRVALNETKAALREAIAAKRIELLWNMVDELDAFIEEIEEGAGFGAEEGQYPAMWEDSLNALGVHISTALTAYEEEGSITAVEAVVWLDRAIASIAACRASVITNAGFHVVLTGDPALGENLGNDVYEFNSEEYTVLNPITTLRFTFLDTYCPNGAKKSNGDGIPVFVALSEFWVCDESGEKLLLSAENFVTNAQEKNEGPMENICDDDYGTFWHSAWSYNISEPHYLEVVIPDGVELTTFSFGWRSRDNRQNIPASVDVAAMSSARAELMSLINQASAEERYVGIAPGFYNYDFSALDAAIAAAQVVLDGDNPTDEEMIAALLELDEKYNEVLDNAKVALPEPGKEYRIISAVPFFEKQGLNKAIGVQADSVGNLDLWWKTVTPTHDDQIFTFEVMANNEGKNFYKMKNKANNRYVADYFITNEDGEEEYGGVRLSATADTVELVAIGAGQFNLTTMYDMHACDHNSGNIGAGWNGTIYGEIDGGIFGDSSAIIAYERGGAAHTASGWYICEMSELPLTALVGADTYRTENFYLYNGVSVITVTADKDTKFEGLTINGIDGSAIETAEISIAGRMATIILDEPVWCFSLSFNNAEGVTELAIAESADSELFRLLAALNTAYEAAVAQAPEEGEDVNQYRDLAFYKAALAEAERVLQNGGTKEEIQAATKAVQDAVAALATLEPNKPLADKVYFIINALEGFEENHMTKMAMYAKNASSLNWTYINMNSQNYLWKFIEVPVEEPTEESEEVSAPCMYYIQNVGTGAYINASAGLAADQAGAAAYAITQLQGTIVALDKDGYGGSNDDSGRLHANQHGGGTGSGSNIVYWGAGIGTASAWRIVEAESYITDIDFTEIAGDDVESTSVVKGIYDLQGRRVLVPSKGLYIVDGKKKVIK